MQIDTWRAVAVACALVTGVVAGYAPARNAARLDPVEALARDREALERLRCLRRVHSAPRSAVSAPLLVLRVGCDYADPRLPDADAVHPGADGVAGQRTEYAMTGSRSGVLYGARRFAFSQLRSEAERRQSDGKLAQFEQRGEDHGCGRREKLCDADAPQPKLAHPVLGPDESRR